MVMPTYGVLLVLWCSYLSAQTTGTRATVLIVIFGITCILPMAFIAVLHNLKVVKSKRLEDRNERLLPYCFGVACYIGAAFYLNHVHAPSWFIMFIVGGILSCVVSLLINLRWKISAHAAGIAGIIALLTYMHTEGLEAFDLFYVLLVAIVLAGMLGTARLLLKRHTLPQVVAGYINGYACVKLMMTLFG